MLSSNQICAPCGLTGRNSGQFRLGGLSRFSDLRPSCDWIKGNIGQGNPLTGAAAHIHIHCSRARVHLFRKQICLKSLEFTSCLLRCDCKVFSERHLPAFRYTHATRCAHQAVGLI